MAASIVSATSSSSSSLDIVSRMNPKRQIIYTSQFPDIPIARRSLFTHLLGLSSTTGDDGDVLVGKYSAHLPAIVEPETGFTLTRFMVRDLSLRLAYGLLNHVRVIPRLCHSSGAHEVETAVVSNTAAARAPQARLLQRGDTILVFSPNLIVYPIMTFAGLAAGLKVTLANAAYTPSELRHQYEDARATAVLVHPSLVSTVVSMFSLMNASEAELQSRIIVAGTDWLVRPDGQGASTSARPRWLLLEELVSKGCLAKEASFDGVLSEETALMCYSSGTTGKPKGVETSHRNLTAMVDMYASVTGDTMLNKRSLSFLPLYHIYGAVCLTFLPFHFNSLLYLMPKFDLVDMLKYTQQYRINILSVVPPILIALAQHPVVQKFDLSTVEYITSGGAALSEALSTSVRTRFAAQCGTNVVVTQGYGLTETSPCTIMDPLYDAMKRPGSIGVLLSNVQARLVDVDTSEDVEAGSPGELWVRGPNVMKGYINNPAATAACIDEQGWFATGDVAVRDLDGYFFIVDRKKELIKYKGFQVPPAELEGVVLEHPDVADVGVIGIDDPSQATELPRAYIVPRNAQIFHSEDDMNALGRSVQEWVRDRVAHHKFLRGGVKVCAEIPRSAAGKILRKDLREIAKKEVASTAQTKARL